MPDVSMSYRLSRTFVTVAGRITTKVDPLTEQPSASAQADVPPLTVLLNWQQRAFAPLP